MKHTGNISLDDVIEIARIMRPRSMARALAGTVKVGPARYCPPHPMNSETLVFRGLKRILDAAS